MKPRLFIIFLLLLFVLYASQNLYTYHITNAQPSFNINANEVIRLEQRGYDQTNLAPLEVPSSYTTGTVYDRIYTNPEDIAQVCDILSSMFVRKYPFDKINNTQHTRLIRDTYRCCYVFYLNDGSIRIFVGGTSHYANIEGDWCYVSSGEKYDYKPLFSVLNGPYSRATRLK